VSGDRRTPYDDMKGTQNWRAIENAISDLVSNNDLVEQTSRDYIVGYICRKLTDQK
jgi:hypothetical protein